MTIYLDNAATTFPKPESVYQAMDRFARQSLANPGRAGHKMALAAEHTLDDGRHRLNRLFNGPSPDRFIFTLNGTDALNIAFKGVLNPGDHVITTDLEHNSVSRPLVAMERAGLISLTRIQADAEGFVDPDMVRAAITSATRLVAITHASNVLGTVQPVDEITQLAHERDTLVLLDAAQTAGVVPIDLKATPIDLLALPGHKGLFGPTGTGALFVSERVTVRPWREGGTGGDSASPTQPEIYPYFLEGGTPNVLGIAGLIAGIEYVESQTLDAIRQHELALIDLLVQKLDEIGGFTVFGSRDPTRRVGTVSLASEVLPAAELGGILDQAFDIAIRPGLHCAPYVHRSTSTFPDGSIRVSPGPFNTSDEILQLAEALREITAL